MPRRPDPFRDGSPVFAPLARGVVIYATIGEQLEPTREGERRVRVYDGEGYGFVLKINDLELA